MAVTTELKALFQISKKSRFDTFTDQYHRLFMVKLLLACTLIVGLSWYGDKINCVMPGTVICFFNEFLHKNDCFENEIALIIDAFKYLFKG